MSVVSEPIGSARIGFGKQRSANAVICVHRGGTINSLSRAEHLSLLQIDNERTSHHKRYSQGRLSRTLIMCPTCAKTRESLDRQSASRPDASGVHATGVIPRISMNRSWREKWEPRDSQPRTFLFYFYLFQILVSRLIWGIFKKYRCTGICFFRMRLWKTLFSEYFYLFEINFGDF